MITICKNGYPFNDIDLPNNFNCQQTFLSGNTYTYTKKYDIKTDTIWYYVYSDANKHHHLFEGVEFLDYFITQEDLRRRKLNKIFKTDKNK